MKQTNPLFNASLRRAAVLALAGALVLAFAPVPAARAADTPPATSADKSPELPLTPSFSKATDPDSGPYLLKLTNSSKSAVTVSGKILLSVAYHAESKAHLIAAHEVGAGQDWTISGLAANDKVVLTAPGYAPLELTVP